MGDAGRRLMFSHFGTHWVSKSITLIKTKINLKNEKLPLPQVGLQQPGKEGAGVPPGVGQREAKCKRNPKHMFHSDWGLDIPPKFWSHQLLFLNHAVERFQKRWL